MKAIFFSFVFVAMGCSGKKDHPPPLGLGEGGPDVDVDVDADSDVDAGHDAGSDAGDAGPDAAADAAPDCAVDSDCDDLSPCNDDVCSGGHCQHFDIPNVDRDRDGVEDARCGGLDCDDANPDVPTAIEECNQVDDDCDGVVDEGLLRETDDVEVSAGTTRYASLEEGFGGFGVVWADSVDELWFARLAPDGTVSDGPYDVGGPVVVDTPGDTALVATSDGFLAAWCGEDGATDRLHYARISDGAAPDLPVEVDLPGEDLCFNPSAAYSGTVVALAWMAVDGADYLPSVVMLNVDGTEAVAPASAPDVANDRSIDVEWLGDTFAVFFRADVGGLLADGGKYLRLGEDGTMDDPREFDEDGDAIGADAASDGARGALLWSLASADGILYRGLDTAGDLVGVERSLDPGAVYPSLAIGAGGILGAWVDTQPVAAPLGSDVLAPTLNLSDRSASSGPPSVAADANGFGIVWSEGDTGLYFNRVECP